METASLQWSARVASALCAASRWCAAASLLMTLTAFALGAAAGEGAEVGASAALALVVVIGALQIYLAMRIEFDRRIFERVAEAAQGWDGFDQAMRELGLMAREKAGRPPAARAAGLATLVRWHAGLLAAQLVLALALILAA